MNPRLEKVRDNFIEAAGQLSASLGLSRVAGQLYGLLYLHDGPLSLDEMVKVLRISKGNVSVNIRELEKWGAVRKVWVKGSRKDHYEAELDVLKVVANRLKEGLQRRINDAMQTVTQANGIINGQANNQASGKSRDKGRGHDNDFTPAERKIARVYTERLNRVKELHRLMKVFLENISRFV